MSKTNGRNANVIAEKKRVIEAMYNDCIRGKQKYQIREKFTNSEYNNSSKGDRTFFSYWNDMMDKFAEEFEENKKQLKSKFISRYLFLYEKFVEEKNYQGAREVLDSLKKMTGMDEPIEANIDLSGELTVDFGLDNETEVQDKSE
jgi:hypothetical protein